MDILYEKLKKIKIKPEMYLGKKSLTLLKVYIDGYIDRQFEINNTYATSKFWHFSEYVQKYYKIKFNRNWEKIINFFTTNDEEAFDKFFELLDEYLKTEETKQNNI